MGLIGPRKEELQHKSPIPIYRKEWVVCDKPTSTLTKGKKYQVLGHFCYLNRKQFDDQDHWWQWDQFITIKNDEGWTVKVNLINFTLVSELEKKAQEKDDYENNPLNILMEANELIPQKYV